MTFNTIFKSSAIALILMSNYALAATAEPGAAPVVTSSAITTADEDSVYTYMMSATDSNVDDLLTWEVTDGESLPSWLSLSNGGATQATLVTGGLNGAKGVAVDDLGNVYITNVASAVNEFPSGIIKFDTDGIKTSFADDGAGEALEWHDGKLYMSYRTGNNGGTAGEIVSYDSDGSNKTVIISGLSEPIGMSFYNDFLFVGQVNGLIGVINPSDNNPVTNQSNYAILDDDLDCKNVAGIQFVGDEGDMLVVCDGTGASTAIFKIELASDAEGPFSGLNSGEVEEFFDLNSTSHQDIQVDKDGFYYVTNRNNVYRKSFLTNRHDFRDDNNEQFSAYGLAQNSSGTLFFANNFAGDLYAIQPGAQLTGTPTNDDVGDHPVALSVNDGTGNVVSHNFVITVANTNDAPIAESQETFAVYKSTPINITLTGTDEDPTNDVLSFSIHSSPSGGTFSQSGEHGEVITYTANEGFSGADSFEFVVNDTIVDSAPVAININVSLNLAPIVSGAQAEQSVTDTTTVTPFSNIELSDGEGDNIALTIDLDDYNNGTLSGTGLTGTGPYSLASDSTANVQAVLRALIFTPAANRVLPGTTETTTFTLVANDGTDDSAANNTATVVSTSVDNSAIISGDFTFSIIEDSGTSATGTMSISDIDAGQTPTFVSGDTVSTYGTLTLSVEGNWSYDLDNALPAVQALSDGATMTDIIIIFADDGTQMDITITITGVNGVAMITGTSAGAATEDNPTQVTGSLSIADEDTGEAVFVAQTNAAGSYGTFNLTISGNWTYDLDSTKAAVQALPNGATLTDSFTASSADSTDSQLVTITITGVNGVAMITGTSTGVATEDDATQITGSLAIVDEDTDEAVFVAQSNTAGSYGTFNLTTSGNWTYDLDSTKTAVQALPDGATLTDSFTASSADSTNSQVTITITGVNGVATITGTSTGAATEDDATQITGSLAIVDEDTGEAVFVAQSNAAGSYGTFNLATSGNWTYDLDSTSVIVHALIDGDTLTDSFTVASADSTDSQLVTITITGVNGEATITGTSTGAATEDDVTVVTGDLTVDDEDTAEAFFVMQTNSEGNYGFFSLTLSGTWSYQLDGSNLDVNVLPEGETLTDSFTVSSFDGTDSQVVTITITGINDAATITGTSIADTNEDNTALITGSLAITDNDTGEAIFMMQSGVAGAYGIFNIDNQGNWTFTLDNDNTEVQQMSSGEQLTDSFTVMSIDGTDSKIITVTVFGANDAPNAEPDEVTVDISVNGVYVIDVLVNDIDVDGDALSIVGANTSLGSVSINGENLTLTTQTGFVGQVELTYTITDGNNTFSKTTVDLLITGALSETAPVIIVPETVEVNAEGLYTKVDLGVATAINSQGQPVPISLVDGAPLFRPGNRIAYWQAIDPETGLTTVASQKVIIHPIISLGKDQVVVEGKKVSVDIILNGEAPKYPVVIALSISGSVDENDYAIQTQEVTIDSGTQTSVLIDIVQDNVIEGNETLIVSLVEGNISNRTTQVITIVESNIAPKVTLSSSQNAEERQLVTPTDGLVSIDAIVVDANDDNFSTQWLYDPALNINEVDEITLTLDPSGLNSGIYSIGIKVIDAGEGNLSTTQTLYLEVLASLAVLTDVDSDGDLIPDNEEGHGDSDQDGIPDYLDAIAECNVMPAQVAVQDGFLVEGDPGVCLRKGNTIAAGETGGLQLTGNDLENSIGIDEDAIIVGGIFDYIATGLPQAGKNYQIVLPQIEPIPAGAVYRKYSATVGWGNFFINVDNQLHSAAGDSGYCPPSESTQWSTGLTEGHWCVQLTIEDGGLNDNDGLANGTIVDPGGVAVLLTSNTMPVAQADVVRVKRNESILIDALANDSDADGDALSIGVATAIFGEVTLTADNQLNYQSKADFIGLDTLVYTLSDGNGGSDSGTVSITVYLNDEPVALDDSAETDDRSAIIITVLDNDSDADGDSLTIVNATVDEGSVTMNENNTLTYTPDKGFDGAATISYTIDDGQGDQAIAQVLVTVNAYQNAMVNNKSNGGSMGLMIISLIGVTLYRMRRKKNIGINQLVQGTAALLVATSMSLAAAEPQWFVTSSVGISDANSHVNIPSDIGITSSDVDKSSTSYTIGGGVNYGIYSFTISYEQLGDSSASYVGDTLDTALFHQALVNSAPKLVDGISLQGQYTLWQDDALSASIGVGLFSWELDYTSQLNDSVIKVSEDDIDLFYNLQIAYAITEQVQVSVKASRYSLIHDINNIALGLTYHF